MASTTGVSNAPILEVLNRDNYEHWRLRMKIYLSCEDLWEVVTEPPKVEDDDEAKHKSWTKKNIKALYAIQNSCGADMFSFISHTEMAKSAWEALEEACTVKGHAEDFELYIPFTDSVLSGDWDKSKECLKELDVHMAVRAVDTRDDYGDIALHVAAREGHLHIVKELMTLMEQEDLKMKNAHGSTALHSAAGKGHVQIVKELGLLMGEIRDNDGDTALHIAVQKERLDVVKELVLLMKQEHLKIKNNEGYTALHLAVKNGNMPIVREIVTKQGVNNVSEGDFKCYIPFTDYVIEGDWNNASECLRELDDLYGATTTVDPRDEYGDTSIHAAIKSGHLYIMRELLSLLKLRETDLELKTPEDFKTFCSRVELDADEILFLERINYVVEQYQKTLFSILEVQNANGRTALNEAVLNGNIEIVRELVQLMRPEGFEVQEKDGRTALYQAVLTGKIDIVRELVPLMRPEGFEVQSASGRTALFEALTQENIDIVRELVPLMRPEGFEVQGESGRTALHEAVLWGNIDIVRELGQLMRPEGFEVQEEDGRTALYQAVLTGKIDIVRELAPLMRPEGFEVQAASGRTALYEALTQENIDIVKELVPLMRPEGFEVQEESGRTALHEAVLWGNIDIVRELVQQMRPEGFEVQEEDGRTALYEAVLKGNIDIVRLLVPLMRLEGFEVQTTSGRTALYEAVLSGNIDVVRELMPPMRPEGFEVQKELAKHMVDRNYKTVLGIIKPPDVDLPVFSAYNNGKLALGHYLYSVTPFEFLMPSHGKNGASLVTICFRAKYLDLALHLLRRCPILVISETEMDCTPIEELAGMRSAFLSGSHIGFWQKFIYNRIHIEPSKCNIDEVSIHISKQEDHQHDKMDLIHSVISLYKKLVKGVCKCLGIDRLYEMKWIHVRILEVLHCISDMIKENTLSPAELDIVKKSIFRAVKYGHLELVKPMCQARPELVKSIEENRNIFQSAAEYRQHKIYSLIFGLGEKGKQHFGTRNPDDPFPTMLHVVGNLSQLPRINSIRGAALQMQSELQWFKEVEDLVPLEFREIVNKGGKTPREIFTENHEKLKEEAEKEMKGTASSCTVVAALIVTIMFAAAFTVPGGNKDTGDPIFIGNKLFLLFIISDSLSLTTSTTAVILFLGILTSRYAEDDFLKTLPTKMMFGLFTLFLSIVTMMAAFSFALTIMLKDRYSWVVTPAIVVAGIPIASFVWVQFPLLIEIFKSTYLGMFDKKVEPWISL